MSEAVKTIRSVLGRNLPSRSLLEQYRPHNEWFLKPDKIGSIHGINHEARVLVWQELLVRLLLKDGKPLDQEALRWAATTHDTQRVDDGIDPQHGERAATWVQQKLQDTIPANSLEMVIYLNRWHVPSDSRAPRMTPDLAVFKDADGLDRVRIFDLDPRYLRWDCSKELLLPMANALLSASEKKQREGYALFDCVLAAAIDLGLIIDE